MTQMQENGGMQKVLARQLKARPPANVPNWTDKCLRFVCSSVIYDKHKCAVWWNSFIPPRLNNSVHLCTSRLHLPFKHVKHRIKAVTVNSLLCCMRGQPADNSAPLKSYRNKNRLAIFRKIMLFAISEQI